MGIWKSLTFSTLALFHGMQSLCHPLSDPEFCLGIVAASCFLLLMLSFCLKEHKLCAQNFPVFSQSRPVLQFRLQEFKLSLHEKEEGKGKYPDVWF